MKYEDIKVGMKVSHVLHGNGVVTDLNEEEDFRGCVWVYFDIHGVHPDEKSMLVNSKNLTTIEEPAEINQKPPKPGDFTINPATVSTKIVEVQEEIPETFTFTVSRKAAHELRAIIGAMTCSHESALYEELSAVLYMNFDGKTDALSFLYSDQYIDMSKIKPLNS